MADVALTPEMRARVYPSRKFPNPTFRDAMLDGTGLTFPFEPEAARKYVAESWRDKDDQKRVKAGLAKNPPAWRPVVERVLARCKHPNAKQALDVDVEAATVTLELCTLWEAVPFWIAEAGIPFALRAMIRCHELACSAREHGYGEGGLYILETRAFSFDWPEDNANAWELMRTLLADAIEPVYDEAHGIADAARLRTAKAKPDESALQLLLPFAFPDETAWAKAAHASAIGLAKQAKRGYTPGLARYVSVAPVETAVELLSCTVNTAVSADDLLTALAHHGPAGGVKIFEAALATTATTDAQRREWGTEMLAIRTAEASTAFNRLAKRTKGAKVFRALAEQYRALG
jgi:hypothetical protein